MNGGSKMSKPSKTAIEAMESMMSPEAVQRARIKAEQEILAIKLGQLREKRGLKQNEINNFSQTSVSRLEKRRDIKISTLVEYLSSLGMGVEIRTYPKDKNVKIKEEVLLKI
jgi:predicted XRE-type DNA-binding protein